MKGPHFTPDGSGIAALKELVPGAYDKGLDPPELLSCSMRGAQDWRSRLSYSERSGVGFAAPGGEFTRAVYQYFVGSPSRQVLLARMRGKAVVELGAGISAFGYCLAALGGAASYVGIEAFYADCLAFSLSTAAQRLTTQSRIPYCVIGEDMLSGLRRLPDRSASIFAFGIERCILGGDTYQHRIEQEIERVVDRSGLYLSFRSDLMIPSQEMGDFTVIRKGFVESGSLYRPL